MIRSSLAWDDMVWYTMEQYRDGVYKPLDENRSPNSELIFKRDDLKIPEPSYLFTNCYKLWMLVLHLLTVVYRAYEIAMDPDKETGVNSVVHLKLMEGMIIREGGEVLERMGAGEQRGVVQVACVLC
jgi:hypothetical protein